MTFSDSPTVCCRLATGASVALSLVVAAAVAALMTQVESIRAADDKAMTVVPDGLTLDWATATLAQVNETVSTRDWF